MANLSSVPNGQIEAVYRRIRESVELAIEAEGLDADTIDTVLEMTDVAVTNEF